MAKIAIVGGSGAVGMAQAWMLAAAGHQVTIVGSRPQRTKLPLQEQGSLSFDGPEIRQVIQDWPETGGSAAELLDRMVLPPVRSQLTTTLQLQGIKPEAQLTKAEAQTLLQAAMTIPLGDNLKVAPQVEAIAAVQDYIAVTVKGPGLTPALAAQIRAIPQTPETPVATFVNGLMPWFRPEPDFGGVRLPVLQAKYDYAAVIGPERLLGGLIIHFGVMVAAPGVVRVQTPWQRAKVAIAPATSVHLTPQLLQVKALYESAAIAVLLPEPGRGLTQLMFDKLAFNMLNAPAAVFGRTVGELLDDPLTRKILVQALEEFYAIAATQPIQLAPTSADLINSYLSQLEQARNLKPSMLQDIEAGRPTEKDEILKTLIDLGQTVGQPTPTLEKIYQALAFVEQQALIDQQQLPALRAKILAGWLTT